MAAKQPISDSMRLDELLVARGLFPSRSRARDAILRGTVTVNGKIAVKAGEAIRPDEDLAVADPARAYVSRAALKLIAALDHFAFDPAGADALDIGASTGGFTEILLERGAAHVIALDVGHGQLSTKLAGDPRITGLEGLNARYLTTADLAGHIPDFLVSDVSFISLKLALPPALALAANGARGIFLIKPQFEAGRGAIGKGGLLRDRMEVGRIAEEMHAWLDRQSGWRAIGLHPSPIEGGDGNREYLLAGAKDR